MTASTRDLLQPSIVGSLPKPAWLAEPNVLRAPWRLSGAGPGGGPGRRGARWRCSIRRRRGSAVVTDGEVRRRHYIWGFLDGLTGIDTERLTRKRSRGGRYSELTEVARLVGPVERRVAGVRGRVPLHPRATPRSG